LPLLYRHAIQLQTGFNVSVRVDAQQMMMGTDDAADDSSQSQWFDAEIVYVSQGPWDAALLHIRCPHPLFPVAFHPASVSFPSYGPLPSSCLPPLGSSVLAIGHALFPPTSALRPTVTAGVLSKVVRLPLPFDVNTSSEVSASSCTKQPQPTFPYPTLLATSAAVHNGNSGGLLVDEQSGYFLGMVSSNVMHTPVWPHYFAAHPKNDEERAVEEEEIRKRNEQVIATIIPHMNFSIPYTALLPLLRFCQGGGQDLSLLREMDAAPAVIQRLWQLEELYPSPPPEPNFSPKYHQLIDRLSKQSDNGSEQRRLMTSSL